MFHALLDLLIRADPLGNPPEAPYTATHLRRQLTMGLIWHR